MANNILWDDELENLANQVIAVHDEETLLRVTDRTIHDLVVSRGSEPLSAADIKMGLKAALGRLVTPN